MYEYTKENLTDEINQKIKFFSKEKYFNLFSYMLIKKSKNFSAFKKVSSLVLSIDNFAKQKEFRKCKKLNITINEEKRNKISPWFYLMIYICNIRNKKRFIKLKKNELNIDPIIYAYMVNYCQNKLKLLHNFSIHHNLNLTNLVKLYLDLCSYQILLDKEENSEDENINQNIINNIKYYSQRKTKFNIKELKMYNSNNPSRNKINIRLQNNKTALTSKKNSKIKLSTYIESKSKKDKKKIIYSNSFTRLFIGETDQTSVKKQYISNVFIKNFCLLKLFNKKIDVPTLYLKKFYNKLSKKENLIDSGMNNILNKFKSDSKMVETYQKNSLSFDKSKKNFDKKRENIKKQFRKKINIYTKPSLKNNKFSSYDKISKLSLFTPNNKYLMNLKNSWDRLNINIKKHKSRNLDFDLSIDDNQGLSQQYSRKSSNKYIKSFRMSINKNNSIISPILPEYKLKLNIHNSPISMFRFRTKKNSSSNNNDIFINIKTKLIKDNDYHLNINHKKFQFKSSLSNELSFE